MLWPGQSPLSQQDQAQQTQLAQLHFQLSSHFANTSKDTSWSCLGHAQSKSPLSPLAFLQCPSLEDLTSVNANVGAADGK